MKAASNNGLFPPPDHKASYSQGFGSKVVLVPNTSVYSPCNSIYDVQAQNVTMCGCHTARTANP